MKTTAIFTAEGRLNTKTKRIAEVRKYSNVQSLPESYRSNTTKEELCQEYVHSFIQQFQGYYPNRRKPFMIAENEVGVKKFVCTTVRPTELPYAELYDMYECASFLAGYMLYEPLDPPTEFPKTLFSPTQAFNSNTADSFEMATLLCSFLLGANYDAYVVCGYAPKFITLRDQSTTLCPIASASTPINPSAAAALFSTSSSSADGNNNKTRTNNSNDNSNNSHNNLKDGDSSNSNSNNSHNSESESSYIPPKTPVMTSQYLVAEAEKARDSKLDTFTLWNPDTLENEKIEVENSKLGTSRVHAWVMVCAGRRDVKDFIFLEPSTGRAYSVANSPYLAIESVWNNSNYWMNLNLDKKLSEMRYDLYNPKGWENLFLYGPKDNARSYKGNTAAGSDASRTYNDGDDNGNIEGGDEENQENVAVDATQTIFDSIRAFDAPPTWVAALSFDRARYLMRYPPMGKRTIQYFCSKADFFAKGVHPQCIVMRVILYLDKARTIVNEIHEWYESRKDKLYKRIRYFLGRKRFIEYYQPGSVGDVKVWLEYPGKSTEVEYYVDGRLDRLTRREEVFGKKIVEYFDGRADHLSYRSTLLTTDKIVAGNRQFTLQGGTLAPELYVLKMTQKFARDPSVESGSDIAKRTFFVKEGKVIAQYHFAKGSITGKVSTYLHTRGPSVPGVSDHAIAQEIGVEEDVDALQEAAALERECYTSIKTSLIATQKIDDYRSEFENSIAMERNVFEIALNKASDIIPLDATISLKDNVSGNNNNNGSGTSSSKAAAGQTKDSKSTAPSSSASSGPSDYLTPFLRIVKNPARITREEALEIRQTCLDALKARLVERANIIQSRLNDENAKLGRKQEQFQRSQREGDLSTEEYEKYCTEAMFRIQILEQRLAAHEEAALKKFAEMDQKLASDPRLKVLKL